MARNLGEGGDLNTRVIDSSSQLQMSTMTEAMRSFKDSISFQFQNLNLALTQLNSNITNLTTKVGLAGMGAFQQSMPSNFITASTLTPTYLGNVSADYAALTANSSAYQTLMPSAIPANIGRGIFAYNAAKEYPFKLTNAGLAAAGSVLSTGAEMLGGWGGSAIGAAIAAPVGAAPIGALVGGLIGSTAGKPIQALVDDAIVHNKDVFGIKRMSARFGGGEFSLGQAQRVTSAIENMAYNERMNSTSLDPMLGMSGYRELTMMGLQSNLFRGSDERDLIRGVENAARVVKLFSEMMGNKTVKESLQMVKQLKDMGINIFEQRGFGASLMYNAVGYGAATGTNPQDLLNAAANISMGTFGARGNPAFIGMQSAMRNVALVTEMEKRQMLTPGEIAAAGGTTALTQRVVDHQAAVLNSTHGKLGLMAGASADGTKFDMNKFRASANGGFFGMMEDSLSKYIENPFAFIANEERLLEQAGQGNNIEEIYERLLRQQFDMNPFMLEGTTTQQKINIAITMLKNEYGDNLDEATARVVANKMFKPSVARAVKVRARRELAIRKTASLNMKNGLPQAMAQAKSIPERIKASIYDQVIRPITTGLADRASMMADSHQYAGLYSERPYEFENIQQLTNAYTASSNILKSTGEDGKKLIDSLKMTAADLNKASATVDDPSLEGNLGLGFSNGKYYRALAEHNRAIADKDIYARMGSKDLRLSSDIANSLFKQGYLTKSTTQDLINQISEKAGWGGERTLNTVKNTLASTILKEKGLTTDIDVSAKTALNKVAANLTKAQKDTLDNIVKNSVSNPQDLTSGSLQAALMRDNTTIEKMAKDLNVDTKTLMRSYISNKYGFDKLNDVDKVETAVGDDFKDMVASLADKMNIAREDPEALDAVGGLGTKNPVILGALDTLGVGKGTVEKIFGDKEQSATLKNDMKEFLTISNKLATNQKITLKDLSKIKGAQMREAAANLQNRDRSTIGTALRGMANREYSLTDLMVYKGGLTDKDLEKIINISPAALANQVRQDARDQVTMGFEIQGIKLQDGDLDTLLKTAGSDDKGNTQANDIVRREINRLKRSGNQEALDNFKSIKEALRKSDPNLSNAQLNRRAFMQLGIMKGEEETANKKAAEEKVNSKIDTVVKNINGTNVVLTRDANSLTPTEKVENPTNTRNTVKNGQKKTNKIDPSKVGGAL